MGVGMKESTCEQNRVLYGIDESLYCTPELITLKLLYT